MASKKGHQRGFSMFERTPSPEPQTSDTTMTSISTSGGLPVDPEAHGTHIVTIEVGQGSPPQTYKMHKAVLCKASRYFAGALSGNFKESVENKLQLSDHDPVAFSVLYEYLYSGNVRGADFYAKGRITGDVLWLRTFKLADATMVHPLLVIAYNRLRDAFNNSEYQVPSILFMHELFDMACPQEKLIDYIVQHAAFSINAGSGNQGWKPWTNLINSVPPFGLHLARQLTKLCSNDYKGSKSHPHSISTFNTDIVFPDPAEPIDLGVELLGGAQHEVKDDEDSEGGKRNRGRT